MNTRNRAAPGHTGNNSLLGEARRKTLPSKCLTSGLCPWIVFNRHRDATHAHEKVECFWCFLKQLFSVSETGMLYLKQNTPHWRQQRFMAEVPILYREAMRTHHTAEASIWHDTKPKSYEATRFQAHQRKLPWNSFYKFRAMEKTCMPIWLLGLATAPNLLRSTKVNAQQDSTDLEIQHLLSWHRQRTLHPKAMPFFPSRKNEG